MRRIRTVLVVAALVATSPLLAPLRNANAQDWDVGPHHAPRHVAPARPSHRPGATPAPGVSHLTAPVQPVPPPETPGVTAAPDERRNRLIAHLLDTLLQHPDDTAVALPALLRLVRERDGNIDALVTDLERRARERPDEAVSHLLLGHVYREADRLDAAAREYTRAESVAPASPAAPRALGDLYRRTERTADARQAWERALARTTTPHDQAEALRAMMDLALAQGDVAGARAFHQRLVALDRTGAAVRRELADALLARRLFPDAVVEYQAVARALAGDNRVLPPVLRDLARAQLGCGNTAEALATLHRGITLAGGDSGVRREIYDLMREVHTQQHDLEGWIAELERQGDGSYERAVLLAHVHDELGQGDAALAAYRRAVALRPTDVDSQVRIVQLLSSLSRLDELLEARRRLVAMAPHNPAYVTELAEELVRHGQRVEALRMLAQASARAGADAEVHEGLAAVYGHLGEARLALHEQELMARADPDSADALGALADAYLADGQRDRALATARRIRDAARDRARGAADLGEWYANHDMPAQAIEQYRDALQLRPDGLDYHKGLAVLLERTRSFEPAVAEWRRVIELARSDRELRREARTRIVHLWDLQGRLPGQLPVLERSFHATPPDLEAGRDLAEAYARLRRPDEAVQVLRQVAAQDHGDVATMVALERVLTQRGDLAGAIEVLRRLVDADASHARDWYQRMAQHALALHHDDEAVDYAAHAVQLNPDDAQGHLRLAELYRARNDLGHAVASFRRALELNDRLFPAYFELADLHLGRNEPREAVDLYRRVIRIAPDDELVARAGRLAIQIAPAGAMVPELERDLGAAAVAAPRRVVLRRLLVDLYASICRPLVNVLRHGTSAESDHARAELARIGTRALKPLLDALADGDATQQRVALEILGYLGNVNATSALVTVAEGTGDLEIRRGALRAAAALGDPRALPRLVALQRSGDTTLAALATWGVARIHTPAAVAALVRVLDAEHPAGVRSMAVLGLARGASGVRDPRARQALLAALDPGNEEFVQAAAVYALGASGEAAVTARLRAALTGPTLLRTAAAAALGEAGVDDGVAADLAAALFSPLAPTLRRVAARSLARLADPRDNSARSAAARVFADPRAADSGRTMLLALLDPPGVPIDGGAALVRFAPQIARAARDAATLREGLLVVLDAFDVPGALAPLVTATDAARPADVAAALATVSRGVAPALAAMATLPDPATRRRVLRVLAATDAPEAAAALVRAVDDPDAAVAETAVRALAARTPAAPGAAAALARRLAEPAPWTLRLAAAEALGRSDDGAVTSALVAALARDPYAYVRASAARALGRRPDPAARAALERAAGSDDDATVRDAARAALAAP